MVKKLLIFFMLFAFIPFSNVKAEVRDPENLLIAPFTNTKQGFPGETLTTFFSGSQTSGITNDLITADGRKADYLQIYWPYHPNLGLQVYPANDGTNPQASIIYFNTGGSTGTPFQMTNLFATNTTTTSIRRTNGGYSTVITVPKNAQNFYVVLYANTENSTTVDQIEDLLNEQFSVQLIANPNTISYKFNDFTYYNNGTDDFIVSTNNPIPTTAVKNFIFYLNNYYDEYTDANTDSYIIFKDAGGATILQTQLVNAEYYNQNIYSSGAKLDQYFLWNIDTTALQDASKFDIYINIYLNISTSITIEAANGSSYYNFDDQIHYAYYYDGFQLIDVRPFSIFAFDLETNILPSPHSNWEWLNPDTNTIEAYNFSNIPNQDIYLYSTTNGNIFINPSTPTIPGTFGGVFTPLDTILNNTGFLNASGLMILYVISLAGILFVVYRFQLGTMLSVIGGILITALFMILGYLPTFASILMIMLFIIVIITMNKGGMLNE